VDINIKIIHINLQVGFKYDKIYQEDNFLLWVKTGGREAPLDHIGHGLDPTFWLFVDFITNFIIKDF